VLVEIYIYIFLEQSFPHLWDRDPLFKTANIRDSHLVSKYEKRREKE